MEDWKFVDAAWRRYSDPFLCHGTSDFDLNEINEKKR